MKYCFDLDGTICQTSGLDYPNAEVQDDVAKRIRQLFDAGHMVIIQTARNKTWRQLTKRQLEQWEILHHGLYFSKQPADIYIDDKAINVNSWILATKGMEDIV